jgi:hypothetical protein
LCNNSGLITNYLSVLSYTGLYERLNWSSAYSKSSGWWIRAPDQARATGTVTTSVVQSLLTTSKPPGVHHIHQLFSLEKVSHQLAVGRIHSGNTKQPTRWYDVVESGSFAGSENLHTPFEDVFPTAHKSNEFNQITKNKISKIHYSSVV